MKFDLSNRRAIMGNDVTVKVIREGTETIARVRSALDGSELGNDILNPPNVQYSRVFGRAGNAGPGTEHVLVVTASDVGGHEQVCTHMWRDDS